MSLFFRSMELSLPLRKFSDDDEPVGDRVNQHFKLNTIGVVLQSVQPEKIDVIRPAFGRLLDVYSMSSYLENWLSFFVLVNSRQKRSKKLG